MTKKQFLIWVIQIGLFTALGALQFVDRDSGGQQEGLIKTLTVFVYSHRLLISILLGLTFALVTGWKDLLYPRKRGKEIRQKIMETMLEELFNSDKNNYRITIRSYAVETPLNKLLLKTKNLRRAALSYEPRKLLKISSTA